ncbi:class I SAM-dependent methyltransferase [Parapedomonas caeni]|jgi:SAM-dependent methyltransferase
MRPTAEDLIAFYTSPLGLRVAREVRRAMTPLLRQRTTDRVLGLGFCPPFLAGLESRVERLAMAMPARQGACVWPRDGDNRSVLVDELALPFADALFDQVVLVHALEFVDPARRLLREVWRVLAPGGTLLVVAANRAGLWTHFEATPFGNGRPFGRAQLRQLLETGLFAPRDWTPALVMPPYRWLMPLERLAARATPGLGGIHVVLADKTDGPLPVRGSPLAIHRPAFGTI